MDGERASADLAVRGVARGAPKSTLDMAFGAKVESLVTARSFCHSAAPPLYL